MTIQRRKPQEYEVRWQWTDPDKNGLTDRMMTDYVFATTAERAIAKVRKNLSDEYTVTRKDTTFLEVRMV
ncbi:hypothetical protein SEA_KABOCHA_95 [Gordonia phage Kabocha]|uniref:Uncharacterized protein n=2 Tax=Chidieberevirus TaxID=3044687 RepID=A0A649VMR6_9CAUD|nr:hypothetical protein PQD14_gp094 [Gordonia phage Chidiebere]YP_010675738.1 hypothetical protein PQD15_gp091 [Gordonia phage ChisanaKitsune]AZS07946.1 hypothetical protein PBI_GRAY_94 [Gordonia phage Gray]WAA19881.1 hypothetical protein SEA_KABOCHA_95 [Gordonia phage Kabocha]WAA20070.1 hypothetical protein SEA_HANEM_93 [Gordonia phage Hanem]WNM67113.1 hypothetical protein SEA_SCHOMBER_92 [Gordonia Phage Schomber]QGJ92983.1 hypothetical protein PBI_CHIDIEBERE_94 [Gordonia phage Chidiebere]